MSAALLPLHPPNRAFHWTGPCPRFRRITPEQAGDWQQRGGFLLRDALRPEAATGSVVVFSSLTPHETGPNRSGRVRKADILQCAPDRAVAWPDGAPEPMPQDHPERQSRILSGGGPQRAAPPDDLGGAG